MPRMSKVICPVFTDSENFKCLENLQRSSIELYLAYCGWEKNQPGAVFGPESRRNHVLHFVIAGKGRFRIEDREWEVGEGDIFYIPPGTRAGYTADETDPWEYKWVGFNGMLAEEFSGMAGFSADHPVRKSLHMEDLSRMIRRMIDAHRPRNSERMIRQATLLEMFSILVSEMEELNGEYMTEESDPDFVQRALDYISHNFEKNIKISILASHLGVSRSYLSSSFRKAVGCSPQSYILNLRMERAASLLRTTTLPINVISITVGYPDQLAFSKIFKQYYGSSPSDFRKSGQEGRLYSRKGDFDNSSL